MRSESGDMLVAVDAEDRPVGVVEKMAAHREGILHRAFSIFVFDASGRTLLQRRALGKYHSGGLWTNACCSHPLAGEALLDAAHRRLRHEMGFDCPLEPAFAFRYRAELDHGMIEHEYDHVLLGRFDGSASPNPAEAMDWKWEGLAAVRARMAEAPESFTAWFGLALDGLAERRLPA